ncbi:MAG: hypothetical protein ABSG26_20520 [Bryobacteraceae bacterium]|jgi:hypothetical protein
MKRTVFAPAIAFMLLALVSQLHLIAQPPTWAKTDRSDALHGTSFTEFKLAGKFLVAPRQSTFTAPVLVLQCRPDARGHGRAHMNDHFLKGWIATGAVLDSGVVEYRLDDAKLQRAAWDVSTDRSGLFLNAPNCWDCNLNTIIYGRKDPPKEGATPRTQKIILGVSEYLGAEIQMQFDLPDSAEVLEACGVAAH